MVKKIKIGTITLLQQLTSERKIRREIDIENNLNISHNRIHKSQKTYTRKNKHKKKLC